MSISISKKLRNNSSVIYSGGSSPNSGGSSGGSGGGSTIVKVNAPAEYVYQNTIKQVTFPSEPITADSENYFAPKSDYDKQQAFMAYNGEVAYFGEYGDSYTVLDQDSATMLNNSYIWIKFNAPVVAKKLKLKHGGSGWRLYATNSKTAFESSFNYTSYDEENGKILVDSGESATVTTEFDINTEAEAYQYYKFACSGTWSDFYEIALIAETGARTLTIKSKNMTPEIKVGSDNYLRVITQPYYYNGTNIDSQTLILKPYANGGSLINYTDDGSAVNLKLYLMIGSSEPIYLLSPDNTFEKPTGYNTAVQVADLNIPARN